MSATLFGSLLERMKEVQARRGTIRGLIVEGPISPEMIPSADSTRVDWKAAFEKLKQWEKAPVQK
jgi:hypothetical protein